MSLTVEQALQMLRDSNETSLITTLDTLPYKDFQSLLMAAQKVEKGKR